MDAKLRPAGPVIAAALDEPREAARSRGLCPTCPGQLAPGRALSCPPGLRCGSFAGAAEVNAPCLPGAGVRRTGDERLQRGRCGQAAQQAQRPLWLPSQEAILSGRYGVCTSAAEQDRAELLGRRPDTGERRTGSHLTGWELLAPRAPTACASAPPDAAPRPSRPSARPGSLLLDWQKDVTRQKAGLPSLGRWWEDGSRGGGRVSVSQFFLSGFV